MENKGKSIGEPKDSHRHESFVEAHLRWLGRLRQSDMQTALGISAATVSRVIGNIARAREKEIRHRSHERSTRKSPLFAPRMIKDGSGPLMDMLRGQALTGRLSNVLGTWFPGIPVEDASYFTELPINTEILEHLLRAIDDKRNIIVHYVARDHEADIFCSPQRFVYAYGRWHVRAFSHNQDEYRDLVLARIKAAAPARGPNLGAPPDREWERFVDLRFRLNPDLPRSARLMLSLERDIDDDDVLKISCRKPLSLYVTREMTRPGMDGLQRWVEVNQGSAAMIPTPSSVVEESFHLAADGVAFEHLDGGDHRADLVAPSGVGDVDSRVAVGERAHRRR